MSSGPIRVWTAPLLLAASSAAGLLVALLWDGLGDAAGWLMVGVPLPVILKSLSASSRDGRRSAAP
jgi:hypothetical protein